MNSVAFGGKGVQNREINPVRSQKITIAKPTVATRDSKTMEIPCHIFCRREGFDFAADAATAMITSVYP
jgi:hypothetical protein